MDNKKSTVGLVPQAGKVVPTPGTPIAGQFSDAQLARIEKAIIVSGVLSGLLAAGRIPTSKDNRATLDAAVREGMELLK